MRTCAKIGERGEERKKEREKRKKKDVSVLSVCPAKESETRNDRDNGSDVITGVRK